MLMIAGCVFIRDGIAGRRGTRSGPSGACNSSFREDTDHCELRYRIQLKYSLQIAPVFIAFASRFVSSEFHFVNSKIVPTLISFPMTKKTFR